MKCIATLFLIFFTYSVASGYDVTNAAARWYTLTNAGAPSSIEVSKTTNTNFITYAYSIFLYDPLDHAVQVYSASWTNRSEYKLIISTNFVKTNSNQKGWYWYALAGAAGLIVGGIAGISLSR